MTDIVRSILSLMEQHPDYSVLVLLVCYAIAVLTWKALEKLVPKGVECFFSLLHSKYTERRSKVGQETQIREFTARTQLPNWVSRVRTISRYHADAPVDAIYAPLTFACTKGATPGDRQTMTDILKGNKLIAVVGPPGSGKSTILNMLAITYARDTVEDGLGLKESRLPLFLNVKDLSLPLSPLPTALLSQYQGAGMDITYEFISEQLQKGRCIVFIDGVDEAGDDRDRRSLVEWIIKTTAAFPSNRFILSCRSYEWDRIRIPDVATGIILPLEPEGISRIAKNWKDYFDRNSGEKGRRTTNFDRDLLSVLLAPGNQNLLDLSKRPLLLTIIIILYASGVRIPDRKAEIYETLLRALLGELDEAKGIEMRNIGLLVERRLSVLQRASLYAMTHGRGTEELDLGDESMRRYFQSELHNVFQARLEPRDFLDNLVEGTGLFYKKGTSGYVYTNRGFIEYLVARELSQKLMYELAVEKCLDEKWYESITMFVSLLPDATSFVRGLLDSSLTRTDQFFAILAHSITDAITLRPNVRETAWLAVIEYTTSSIAQGLDPEELVNAAYSVDPAYWVNRLMASIKTTGGDISPFSAASVLLRVGGRDALRAFDVEYATLDVVAKRAVVSALGSSLLPDTIESLWKIIEDPDVTEEAIVALVNKGDDVIWSCQTVLVGDKPDTCVRAAVIILSRLGSPVVLPVLRDVFGLVDDKTKGLITYAFRGEMARRGMTERQTLLIVETLSAKPNAYAVVSKRVVDFVGALIGLVLGLPIMLVTAALIKLESPGNVFYSQMRIGHNRRRHIRRRDNLAVNVERRHKERRRHDLGGKPFRMLKFRTLSTATERENGPAWTAGSDPRITKIGLFLRKTALDELPQFVNVLRGDMSLVGPRPERPNFIMNERSRVPGYELRLAVRPGLTGLAQTEYHFYDTSITSLNDMPRLDLEYAFRHSLVMDARIMLRTAVMAIKGRASE